jgi:hypothetical protein
MVCASCSNGCAVMMRDPFARFAYFARIAQSDTLQKGARILAPWIPWFSLAWGLVTASLITRNISDPGRFVAAGVFFVFLSLVLQLVAAHAWSQNHEPGRKRVFGFFSSLILQSAAQYFLMFALPFLYFGQYWFAFAMSALFAAVTLWDPWWAWAFKHPVLPVVLRQWVCGLLLSSIMVAFVPSFVAFTSFVVLLACLYLSHFWSVWSAGDPRVQISVQGGTGLKVHLVSLFWKICRTAAVLILPVAAGLQFMTRLSSPFPLLGVWLQQPAFTFGRPTYLDRDTFGPTLHVLENSAIQSGPAGSVLATEICCVTPIIASSSFGSRIEHHWFINGREFETIVLPIARGNGEGAAFRTYSCKRKFARLEPLDTISCDARVLGGITLGTITIQVSPSVDAQ